MYTDPSLPRWIDGWQSPRLGLDMPIACYGDYGRPLLMFPTAAADFLENERFWLIKAIEHHIFAGKVRVFCVESINKHSWMNDSLPIPEKARRQMLYARYIEEEVVPFVRAQVRNPSARLATCGASFGGFHAANQFFRRPDLFDTVIAMSGFYDLEPSYTFDYRDDNVYFNNPVAYIANMSEGPALDLIRHHSSIHILTGQGRWEAPNRSKQLSGVLWDKGIGHNLDLWGFDVDHDWPWWRKMLDHYIGERLGW
jgi:esterase/lipase superfamily enzyme